MKRVLTIILCSIVSFVAMANDSLYADANGDGKITMADVEFIYDYILCTNNANTSFAQVDINGDGKVNTLDIVEIYVAMRALQPKEDKTIVFVEGVNRESGWYDVNKVGKGDNGDINMCWAASAANIIEWWQDRYVAGRHRSGRPDHRSRFLHRGAPVLAGGKSPDQDLSPSEKEDRVSRGRILRIILIVNVIGDHKTSLLKTRPARRPG